MQFAGFDWDAGNRKKCQKHGLSIAEIESLFVRPVVILPDEENSDEEQRFRAIGTTASGRYAFVVFTRRDHDDDILIRPISARFMHMKEVKSYEKEDPDI